MPGSVGEPLPGVSQDSWLRLDPGQRALPSVLAPCPPLLLSFPPRGPAELVLNLDKPLSVSPEGGALFPGVSGSKAASKRGLLPAPSLQPHLLLPVIFPGPQLAAIAGVGGQLGLGLCGTLMAPASGPLVS